MENKSLNGSPEEEDMEKLLDNELEKVSGGFVETQDVPTKGMEIKCPICNNDSLIVKGLYYNPKIGSVEYHCKKHGSFVCYGNDVIMIKDWKALCAEKGIEY